MEWRDFVTLWRPISSIMTILALWGLWSLKKLTASKDDLRGLENRVISNEKFIALVEEKCASRIDFTSPCAENIGDQSHTKSTK